MYECMYECMYVCMYVCMYTLMGEDSPGYWFDYDNVCMYVCMHACIYVCVCKHCTEQLYLTPKWCWRNSR